MAAARKACCTGFDQFGARVVGNVAGCPDGRTQGKRFAQCCLDDAIGVFNEAVQDDDVDERRVGGTDKKALRGKPLFELRVDFKLENLQKAHHANET